MYYIMYICRWKYCNYLLGSLRTIKILCNWDWQRNLILSLLKREVSNQIKFVKSCTKLNYHADSWINTWLLGDTCNSWSCYLYFIRCSLPKTAWIKINCNYLECWLINCINTWLSLSSWGTAWPSKLIRYDQYLMLKMMIVI